MRWLLVDPNSCHLEQLRIWGHFPRGHFPYLVDRLTYWIYVGSNNCFISCFDLSKKPQGDLSDLGGRGGHSQWYYLQTPRYHYQFEKRSLTL